MTVKPLSIDLVAVTCPDLGRCENRRPGAEGLFQSLVAGKSRQEAEDRLFLMLTIYLDDSGTASDPSERYFVMAGFAATTKGWRGFDRAWKRCLQTGPRLDRLKTADFMSLRGEYAPTRSRWNPHKRDQKLAHPSAVTQNRPVMVT